MKTSNQGKTEVIYCRVNETLKARLEREAAARGGESEALIVREALLEYFRRRDQAESPAETTRAVTTEKAPAVLESLPDTRSKLAGTLRREAEKKKNREKTVR